MDKQFDEEQKNGIKVNDPMNRRIEFQGKLGFVRYFGPLKHDLDKYDPSILWVGVEWDDPTKGKHNGTVADVEYFKTQDNKNSGSLVKADKVNFGINLYDGILLRYFNNKPSSVQDKENENKNVNEKGITVEYDEEAYFETAKKFKKKVEFLGFDKIWKKINDLKNIEELSLPDCHISDIGPDGALSQLLPKLKNFSLEGNQIFDWNQIYLIGKELTNLEQLSLTGNQLNEPEDVRELKQIKINSNDTTIPCAPLGNTFQNLKVIVFIQMNLTWKSLNKVIPVFKNVESLVLCFNKCNDFENLSLTGSDFKNLTFLNLEGNKISDFSGICKFKDAPKLQRLILSKNQLSQLGKFDGFNELKTLIIEENEIKDFKFFQEMNQFPTLKKIRVVKNPIYQSFSQLHIRQRAIAEIENLDHINGSELKKYDRKDCEIYYLRDSFREYFEKTGQNAYKYDFDQFTAYASVEHPRVAKLIEKFGNPYEDVKEDDQPKHNKTSFANFVNIKLNALSGPGLGRPAVNMKFPENTLLTNLKAMLSKQFGIPANKQKVFHKASAKEPFVQLEEDLKDFRYYGVKETHEIWVSDDEFEL